MHPCSFTSFSLDVSLDIRRRPSVSVWTNNMTSVDVHKFLYGRKTCGYGRPPVTIWTYNKWTSIHFYMDVLHVAVDIHQLLYGRTTLHPWTSTSSYMDNNVRPWTSTSYYEDVQQKIDGRSSSSIRMCNDWPWTSTS